MGGNERRTSWYCGKTRNLSGFVFLLPDAVNERRTAIFCSDIEKTSTTYSCGVRHTQSKGIRSCSQFGEKKRSDRQEVVLHEQLISCVPATDDSTNLMTAQNISAPPGSDVMEYA